MDREIKNNSIGRILMEEFMEPRGLSAYKVAHDINVPVSRIQDILHDRRKLTIDTGLRLARYFDLTEKYFIDKQTDIDIREAKVKFGDEFKRIKQAYGVQKTLARADILVRNSYGTFLLEDIINDFKDRLYATIDRDVIKSMTLFGSYAKGTQTEESDIDICMIFDDQKMSETDINLRVGDVSNDMIDLYGVDIAALCFKEEYYINNRNTSLLFQDIEKEGIAC